MIGGTDVGLEFLDRVQREFAPEEMSQQRLEEWLFPSEQRRKHTVKWGKDKQGRQRYKEVEGASISPGTRRLAEKLSTIEEVYSQAEVEADIDALEELKESARKLPVHSPTVVKRVDESIEVAKEVERQEVIKTEESYRDFMIERWKEAETAEEERETRRELKEELPYSLRSAKGWKTREGKKVFQSIMFE